MIPKIIYRSWFTQNMPPKVDKSIKKLKRLNPEYDHIIYTDSQIEDYVNANFDEKIKKAFNSLEHIVPKVDFWRYLILYKNGGIYVDIDSSVNEPLNKIIDSGNEGIVSAEKNKDNFVQWALFFKKGHPILKEVIEIVTKNINNNLYPNYLNNPEDLIKLTAGGPFTKAIKTIHKKYFEEDLVWSEIDDKTDLLFEFNNNKESFNYRLLGVDFNGKLSWKSKESYELYNLKQHWLKDLEDNSKTE